MYITYILKVHSKLFFEIVKSHLKSLDRQLVSDFFIHVKGPLGSISQSDFYIYLHANIKFNFMCLLVMGDCLLTFSSKFLVL